MSRRATGWLPWVAGILIAGFALAALDWRGAPLSGWPGYLALVAICAGVLWSAWRWGSEATPRQAAWAVGAAIALRLAVAIILAHALPTQGYDTPHQRAGYFFPDAYDRDNAARVLAQSDEPLLRAFTEGTAADQYGGLLFLSALVYRVFSPEVHRPLLVVLITATLGGLAALFTWRFAQAVGGRRAGVLAGWLCALYPEMVLLGASQMREPFIVAGLALALFGYTRWRAGSARDALVGVGLGVLLATAISPPYGLLVAGIVLVAWMWAGRSRRSAWGLAILVLIAVAAFVLTIRAWSVVVAPAPGASVFDLVGWWLSDAARFEVHKLEEVSGVVQVLFDQTPDWAHIPMATGYGLVRPFLPAALTEEMAPLARGVEIARALGWVALLPFLLYAPLAALRATGLRGLPTYLSVVVWATAVLSSYRAGGDGWDNVRYRAVFLAAQAGLAGWAWAHARESGSPWLRRVAVIVGGAVIIFLQWYLGRYLGTPRLSLNGTLALLVGFVIIGIAGPLIGDWRRRRRLTGSAPAV